MIYVWGALLLVAALLGVVRVAIGTLRQDRWGLNWDPVNCPRCGAPFAAIRAPANWRQALWGGGTCRCGCEVDKWGREV